MKITELDLKSEGKKYKNIDKVFKVKDGDLLEVETNIYLKDLCIPISELLEMEFEEIKEMKNPYERVKYGAIYFLKNAQGDVDFCTNRNDSVDNKRFNNANYFNNSNYAEYIVFKENLMRKLDKFAWEHNAQVIDWNDCSEKFSIVFNHENNKLIILYNLDCQYNNIFFTSREIAEKAIEEFKEDLIKLYTWKFDF